MAYRLDVPATLSFRHDGVYLKAAGFDLILSSIDTIEEFRVMLYSIGGAAMALEVARPKANPPSPANPNIVNVMADEFRKAHERSAQSIHDLTAQYETAAEDLKDSVKRSGES